MQTWHVVVICVGMLVLYVLTQIAVYKWKQAEEAAEHEKVVSLALMFYMENHGLTVPHPDNPEFKVILRYTREVICGCESDSPA